MFGRSAPAPTCRNALGAVVPTPTFDAPLSKRDELPSVPMLSVHLAIMFVVPVPVVFGTTRRGTPLRELVSCAAPLCASSALITQGAVSANAIALTSSTFVFRFVVD